MAVSMLIGGCAASKNAEPAPAPAAKQQPVAEAAAPAAAKAEAAAPAPKAAPAPVAKAKPAAAKNAAAEDKPCDLYNVEVSMDDTSLDVGKNVSLYVHVKANGFPLTGHEAHGVTVTFSGLDFAANPPAVECLRVHPNGSDIIYNVTAANAGTYDVVANVAFYPTRHCEASRVTKQSNALTVNVK
ncbi:hypothetical protein [Sulfurimonas diazotrophicus]|uniref:Uncharacterized protein n=1 Tax=Sulfurimonas diazotrophicus TaxID=3131939 RepID=A0ABZ3H9M3_9BACT